MLKTSVQQLQQILILKNRSSQLINVQRNLSYVRISQHHDINRVKYSNVYHQQQRTLFGWWGKSSTPKIETTQTTVTEMEMPQIETVFEPVKSIQRPEINFGSGYVPEIPEIPDLPTITPDTVNTLGEATLRSLGLGSYITPTGWVQLVNELIHVELDLPWYQSIIAYTLILRTLLLPLTIKIQRNAANMKVVGSQMVEINKRIAAAQQSNNNEELIRSSEILQEFMKHNFKISSMFVPFAQVPFVMSSFLGIRAMCNLPVESMKNGGTLWFENLTIADPFCILPLTSCATLFIILERGLETGQDAESMGKGLKWFLRATTFFALPFFIYFPSGVMVYICTSNIFSLVTVSIIRTPTVRKFLKIAEPPKNTHIINKPKDLSRDDFLNEFRTAFKNQIISGKIEERERIEKMRRSAIKPTAGDKNDKFK